MPHPSTRRSPDTHRPEHRAPRRRIAAAAAVLVAIVVVAVAIVGARASTREAFAPLRVDGAISRIVVDVDRGDVVLMAVPAAGVTRVEVARRTSWRLTEPELGHVVEDGELRLTSRCRGVPIISTCRVDHHLDVPRGVGVEVRAGDGAVTIDGLDGALVIRTHRSAVEARALASAEAVVTSDGGDVELAFADAPSRVVVSSGGGDVEVVLPGGPYDLDLGTSGAPARVEIGVRGSAERMLTVASDGGSVWLRPPGRSVAEHQR